MKLVFAIAGVLLLAVPSAHADIYKCVGSDGHVTYSNMGDRNCKRLSLDPVPASTSAPASAAAGKPAAAKSPTPAGFPKVEEGAQKSRDNDRRRILEGELAAEQKNLEQAKKEMADQEAVRLGGERNYQRVIDRVQPFKDKVALHERNIEAIQSEISRLR
jgi:hypothetical protein